MIPKKRIKILNSSKSKDNKFGLYWMQRAQRVSYNHALEYAVRKANNLNVPLIVLFIIIEDYPYSNKSHIKFMLEGLKETISTLKNKGIQTVVINSKDRKQLDNIFKRSSFFVFDKGYLKYEKEIRKRYQKRIDCFTAEIETDLIVPVEAASNKEEYAAYTIRNKINSQLGRFLKPLNSTDPEFDSLDLKFNSLNIDNLQKFVKELNVSNELEYNLSFKGGFSEANKILNNFIENKIQKYDEYSNNPCKNYVSNLSPYLHFGQISPLFIAKQIARCSADRKNKESFLEQLVIRRELSFNFVYYNSNYDNLNCLPEWAYNSLMKHKDDKRTYVYSYDDFEKAKTHDKYWNAAQREMKIKGKMANYMRMYWGKKVLEWSCSPEKAFEILIKLNNKYQLDGRDPNSYAGIAWCFGKHDRAWKERKIYGKIRYMNSKGLERKFDMDEYVEQINSLI